MQPSVGRIGIALAVVAVLCSMSVAAVGGAHSVTGEPAATSGAHSVTGEPAATSGAHSVTAEPAAGTAETAVPEPTAIEGERTIEKEMLAPGESTTVVITADISSVEDPSAIETLSQPAADLAIVETEPLAIISAVNDANDEVFAAWDGVDEDEVRLEYELTAPAAPSGWTTIELNTTDGDNSIQAGSDEIVVTTLFSYTNDQGKIDTDALLEIVADWRQGEVGSDLLRAGIDAWGSGERID